MYPKDHPGFKVTAAVAVVIPGVIEATSGVETIVWLGKFSVEKYRVGVLPAGMFVA
jgi:hypothetical protein